MSRYPVSAPDSWHQPWETVFPGLISVARVNFGGYSQGFSLIVVGFGASARIGGFLTPPGLHSNFQHNASKLSPELSFRVVQAWKKHRIVHF